MRGSDGMATYPVWEEGVTGRNGCARSICDAVPYVWFLTNGASFVMISVERMECGELACQE